MRVYLPSTVDGLRRLAAGAGVAPGASGYAATTRLLEQLGELGDEEVEFALTTAAAAASLELIADAGAQKGRRVVVVAEVGADVTVEQPEFAGQVTVSAPVPLSGVDAILADTSDVDVVRGSDDDLGWFATQELGHLLA